MTHPLDQSAEIAALRKLLAELEQQHVHAAARAARIEHTAQDIHEFLAAQAESQEHSYWRLRRWAEAHGQFIDDLADLNAFRTMAKVAKRLLKAALEST